MYKPPTWIDPLLFLPGTMWETVLRTRNRLFDSGALAARSLPRPVISVGNMTLGGSGKTPLTIYIARLLAQTASTPVVLTRGYGRRPRNRCDIVPPDSSVALSWLEMGDEPALVRRNVPGVWLGVSADRHEAGIRIAARVPGAVFILDDGFQHRRLRRDLDLLIVDGTQPLETNRVFPRGSLREPIEGIRRSHAVLINGITVPALSETIERLHPLVRIFHCQQGIDSIVPYPEWAAMRSAAGSGPSPVFLAAAVGNPHRFQRDVTALGIPVCGSRFYRDHFAPGVDGWRSCWKEARSSGAEVLLTTEKDAVKIPADPGVPLMVAVQSTRIVESDAFREMILRAATV
jgi:tetraacyldisaccharide 4'-kinase